MSNTWSLVIKFWKRSSVFRTLKCCMRQIYTKKLSLYYLYTSRSFAIPLHPVRNVTQLFSSPDILIKKCRWDAEETQIFFCPRFHILLQNSPPKNMKTWKEKFLLQKPVLLHWRKIKLQKSLGLNYAEENSKWIGKSTCRMELNSTSHFSGTIGF